MRVSRWLLGLILLLAVIVPAQAQQAPPTTTKTLTSATCPGTGCLIVGSAGYGGLGVQVSGTFSATIVFEGIVSGDTTGTYTAVTCTPWNSTTGVTSTTAAGLWGCPVGGLSFFRVRVSSYTSGSAVITTLKAPTLARGSGGGGGGGGIGGGIGQYEIAVGSGTDTITGIAPGTSGYVLTSNGAGANPTYQAAPGGSPGGALTSLQYNNGGAFGGFGTWDATTLEIPGGYRALLGGMGRGIVNATYGSTAAAEYAYDAGTYYGLVQMAAGANAFGVYNDFLKTRSTNGTTRAAAQTNDTAMVLNSYADTGSATSFLARISTKITGAVGGTNWPGQIDFSLGTGSGTAAYAFAPTLFTAPGGINAAGGTFAVDGSGNLTVASCTGCGGGGTPGGSNGNWQYNNAGAFGGFAPGTGVQTWVVTPSSANLASAVTDETGSGVVVFGTSPTFTTSIISAAGITVDLGTASTWSVRNSTNPITSRWANTWTDASNNEYGRVMWLSNVWHIGTVKNGTGTARVMSLDFGDGSTSAISIPAASGTITFGGGPLSSNGFYVDATNRIYLGSTNTITLASGGAGDAWAFGTSALTIGNWGGSVAKTIGVKTQAGNSNRASDYLQFDADGGSGSGAAGYLVIRAAVAGSSGTAAHTLEETFRSYLVTTAQPMIGLGGVTSSFPAFRRVTTTLEARLADDSAYTGFQSLYERFGSGSPEGAVSAPVGAIFHRTDGGASTSLYVKESGSGNTGWVAK